MILRILFRYRISLAILSYIIYTFMYAYIILRTCNKELRSEAINWIIRLLLFKFTEIYVDVVNTMNSEAQHQKHLANGTLFDDHVKTTS